MKKKICFDIDGVICNTKKNDYSNSKPIKKNIKVINKIYNSGYIVVLYTARYMGRTKDNAKLAKKKGYNFTKKQLFKWGVKYHSLFFGKPSFDLIVDDKSFNFNKAWSAKILKYIKNKY